MESGDEACDRGVGRRLFLTLEGMGSGEDACDRGVGRSLFLALEGMGSGEDACDRGVGRTLFLMLETPGTGGGGGAGADGAEGGGPGGLGAEPVGGLGARDNREGSGSEEYAESLLAPVDTPPPVFFSFGIPPAKIPPSCGAAAPALLSLPDLLGASLFARALFAGVDGTNPGTGGAPPTGGPPDEPPEEPATMGADRSFVTAFFNALPFVMSPSKAPCPLYQLLVRPSRLAPAILYLTLFFEAPCGGRAGRLAPPPPGNGGGGGGPAPKPGIGGGGGGPAPKPGIGGGGGGAGIAEM